MRLVCHPTRAKLPAAAAAELPVLLYGRADAKEACSAGAAIAERLRRMKLVIPPRAWDLLSIAISTITADGALPRRNSPDGWTREIELVVAVSDPAFWNGQAALVASMLQFLTTDRWAISFVKGAYRPRAPKKSRVHVEESVVLLSGGLDSLVGTLDLVEQGVKPLAVSQTARGDGEKQIAFARVISGGLTHVQLNHNALVPGKRERSQRSRSLVFLTYGVVAATALQAFRDGKDIPLFVCENGLIAINPPLTDYRIGSLSTRTAHPTFLSMFQELIQRAGLRVVLQTPYAFKTKGEMLVECSAQAFLREHAHSTTSCGRFGVYGMRHCGRCLPCLIRRAAFRRWRRKDATDYVYADLSKQDGDHAAFDDVRSAAMGVARMKTEGVKSMLGASLASRAIEDSTPYYDVVERGLSELGRYLNGVGVK